MTSDEAEAAAWLEEQFWKEVSSSQYEFLWWPRKNFATGQLMWLCKAVKVEGSRVDHIGSGAKYTYTQTRWYKPKDFVMKRLSN